MQTQYRTAIEHEPNLLTAAESSFPAIDVTGTGRLTMGEAQQQEQGKQSLAGWGKDRRGMGELGAMLPGIDQPLIPKRISTAGAHTHHLCC